MVRAGMAWALLRYSHDYVVQEGEAQAADLGVHAHACQPAWEWRASHKIKADGPRPSRPLFLARCRGVKEGHRTWGPLTGDRHQAIEMTVRCMTNTLKQRLHSFVSAPCGARASERRSTFVTIVAFKQTESTSTVSLPPLGGLGVVSRAARRDTSGTWSVMGPCWGGSHPD